MIPKSIRDNGWWLDDPCSMETSSMTEIDGEADNTIKRRATFKQVFKCARTGKPVKLQYLARGL